MQRQLDRLLYIKKQTGYQQVKLINHEQIKTKLSKKTFIGYTQYSNNPQCTATKLHDLQRKTKTDLSKHRDHAHCSH